MGLFDKKVKASTIEAKKNWYADRYQTVVVQRNMLLIALVLTLAGIIFSVLAVVKITTSKTIEPFVIEIEDKTGITNVIRPLQPEKYEYNEVLRRYFLTMYLNAREGYSPSLIDYNYYKVVALLSSGPVYNIFKYAISQNNPDSPIRELGQEFQRGVRIKSITYLTPGQGQTGFLAQVRFFTYDYSISGTADQSTNQKHKLATVNFSFADLQLTEEQRAVNPLGFQVTGYRLDDEVQ